MSLNCPAGSPAWTGRAGTFDESRPFFYAESQPWRGGAKFGSGDDFCCNGRQFLAQQVICFALNDPYLFNW